MSQPTRSEILGTLLPGFVGTSLPDWLAALLREGLGGVCLFGGNIESREQTAALTAAIRAANPDAIIAIDEEGGDVTRLYYDRGAPYPGNALLGRIGELALTERTARSVGWQLREVGVNVTFAPDADINSNPDNPVIGVRSFGTDPGLVADHTAAWVGAVQATGVGAAAKHFPGHGDTAQDSHLALPVVGRSLGELRERELVPFRAAIEAGTELIMTSHILLPQLDPDRPATMSAPILRGLLRDELGFTGVIVSDALDMKGASGALGIPGAAVQALAAGVDLLCIGTDNSAAQLEEIAGAVAAAVASGALAAERVADASRRVRLLAERLRSRASAAPLPASPVPQPEYDLDEIAGGFDVSAHAREWIAAAGGQYEVVRIESVSNIAVGVAPWGVFAAAAVADVVVAPDDGFETPAVAGSSTVGEPPVVEEARSPVSKRPRGPVAIIGKDLHRRAYARDYIDAARTEHGASVLVIDMGWPGDDRAYADVATFGASRLAGQALLRLLGGGA
ncbi:glycoside hydrolase family 3 protein [Gryllotalpicola koreensis]|uniref:Glycoside hydrolase family 3 N-terminal domain-containing protein n=1 Tax=Gryllotalpicola koreensis TaxID=993086 RepID=A0ABP8A3X3_9MICO